MKLRKDMEWKTGIMIIIVLVNKNSFFLIVRARNVEF